MFQYLIALLLTFIEGLESREISALNYSLTKTVLFKAPLANFLISLLYLLSLAVTVVAFGNALDTSIILSLWIMLSFLRLLGLFIAYNHLLIKEFIIKIPYNNMLYYFAKFLLASSTIVIIKNLCYSNEVYGNIFQQIQSLIIPLFLFLISYIGVMYLIDSKFRGFLKNIVTYILKIINITY